MATLADLESKGMFAPEELIKVIREYAESGAAIGDNRSTDALLKMLECTPTAEEFDQLLAICDTAASIRSWSNSLCYFYLRWKLLQWKAGVQI